MIPIPPSILAFFAKPLVKFGLPALLVVLAIIGFRVWLGAHDRAIRAEYLNELTEQQRVESQKAATKADKASAERKEITDAAQDRIAGSNSVDDLFNRLRGQGSPKPSPSAP